MLWSMDEIRSEICRFQNRSDVRLRCLYSVGSNIREQIFRSENVCTFRLSHVIMILYPCHDHHQKRTIVFVSQIVVLPPRISKFSLKTDSVSNKVPIPQRCVIHTHPSELIRRNPKLQAIRTPPIARMIRVLIINQTLVWAIPRVQVIVGVRGYHACKDPKSQFVISIRGECLRCAQNVLSAHSNCVVSGCK